MKTLFSFFATLGIVGIFLAFCYLSMPIAALVLICYLLIGGIFFACFAHNIKLRKKWRVSPVPWDSPEFDSFFWNLTLVNQDWYIEEILHREGLQQLMEKYETEIIRLWQDTTLDREEKIERTSCYLKRLKTLSITLTFNYELRPH